MRQLWRLAERAYSGIGYPILLGIIVEGAVGTMMQRVRKAVQSFTIGVRERAVIENISDRAIDDAWCALVTGIALMEARDSIRFIRDTTPGISEYARSKLTARMMEYDILITFYATAANGLLADEDEEDGG